MAPVLCCSAPVTRAPFLAVLLLVLLQQARSPPLAVAARTNLTAGATMAPPDYISSPSGGFAFGFRAFTSDPTKFLLATWFRFGGDDSSQPQPESVVWFAKQSPSGATPNATAQSVLSITADGQLTLTDGSKHVLWTPSLERGSVLALRDSGNLQFLSDSGSQVLWESFWYPTDTLLPGQSLVYDLARSEGKVFAKRVDAEFTTGRFSMGIQSDGNVVLYVDLLKGNDPHNAYWQAYTNSPDRNTMVTFDDRGRLNYTLHNGTVSSLIKPVASFAAGEYFQFARMDPDGIVRTYIRPKDGGTGNTSWTVSGAFPDYGCIKWTSGLQGMCGPGSYCLSALTPSSRDRLNCVCPSGYNYTDEQHRNSGCTPAFEPQSCDGENSSDEFTPVELLNTTWETSIYYKKFSSVTEEQCREYCLSDCFCTAALMIGGSDCAEVAVLTNGWRANGVTTKALIKVRTRNYSQVISRTRNAFAYKVIAISLAFLLIITIGGLVAQHCVTKNRERQRLLSPSVRSFSWKELHEATNGFEKLLGKGYIAPEWLHNSSRVDTKADVYSFGVVLLEMICCRKCHEPVTPDLPQRAEEEDETVTLFGWAAQLASARRTELMLHGDADVDTVEDLERVERFARVALWCIEPNPLLRPTMHQVVQMLETSRTRVEALPDPAGCYMESSPLIPQLKIE
ncbi:G-type lectin S-receptor-like serine/threonine-protein kinase RLK1 [Panicum miliaceum]|uniref:non-specific serine/threonine protein kinase n=1 Tax=Panicum miliaceum TaxID=4540 RepID=A0A3L6PX91_PANMI|nr:G-type lectin S-receptor-like serine/threonine-protein kinase RLK1 [Panicum miliaceum]